jgi:adenylate kinase
MRLILFGSPGVGKGTQAKILTKKLGVPHFSTGDILRQEVKDKTPIGIEIHDIIKRGDLASDEIMIEIIKKKLAQPEFRNGFIIDGFPRTIPQVKGFHPLFEELHINDPLLVSLTAHEDELVQRLTNRRACSKCQNIFKYSDIKGTNICPICGSVDSFYLRNDDNEEVILRRFRIFQSITLPLLEYYEKKNMVIYVNGFQSVEKVTADILQGIVEKTGKEIKFSA